MKFGDTVWRPRLRQIGWAPKGEDWRCFYPGLALIPGEGEWVDVELSLVERFHMFFGYKDAYGLRELMKDADVYHIEHLGDLFKAVLHLPKPLAELLDEAHIPRVRQVWKFEHMFGPPPLFHGPLEPNGLLPHGTLMDNDKELLVQPSFRHLEMLPIFKMPSVESWNAVSKLLAEHEHKQA